MPEITNEKIDQVSSQIKVEIERRIDELMAEYRRRGKEILSPDEQSAYTEYLSQALENPNIEMPDAVRIAFQKLGNDDEANALFNRLNQLVKLRDKAKALVPDTNQVAGSKSDQLREILTVASIVLIQVAPDPANWIGWLVVFLENLEEEAKIYRSDENFINMLDRLSSVITNRLISGKW